MIDDDPLWDPEAAPDAELVGLRAMLAPVLGATPRAASPAGRRCGSCAGVVRLGGGGPSQPRP